MWDVQGSIKDLLKGTEDDCTPLLKLSRSLVWVRPVSSVWILCSFPKRPRLLLPLPRELNPSSTIFTRELLPKHSYLLFPYFLISLLFSLPTVTQFSRTAMLFYTTSSYILLIPANSANVTLRKFMTIALFQNISYSAHKGKKWGNSDCLSLVSASNQIHKATLYLPCGSSEQISGCQMDSWCNLQMRHSF